MRPRLKRLVCRIVGHDWNDWESDVPGGPRFITCRRCPAYRLDRG